MKPAFSVIFLTTLIGAGQGLFIALVVMQPYSRFGQSDFGFVSSVVALALMVLGLIASFFHLGRPERAWRAVSCWRTSWLSREVIVLPIAMVMVFAYGWLNWSLHHSVSWVSPTLVTLTGWLGVAVMLLLFVCTAMIYACIKFLQEWASPWTIVNFCLLGTGSGFLLATGLAARYQFEGLDVLRLLAIALIAGGLLTRLFSFYRNGRIKRRSTVQSAIGIKHRHITQRSMGLTGGSFNTRAFFHHCSALFLANVRKVVLVTVFAIPLLLLLVYAVWSSELLLWLAIAIQYPGLLAERWLFFAQANHPQNLYYQTVG